jgi:hypothetical protein
MGDARDAWGKAEVIISAVAALGSIAIPVALFVVGNGLSARQQEASARQLEADRVERMLGHLTSDKPDEKKLAVRVLEFFVTENQFPAELLPAVVEIASTDTHEDVADTASEVLQKVASQTSDKQTPPRGAKGTRRRRSPIWTTAAWWSRLRRPAPRRRQPRPSCATSARRTRPGRSR